MVQVVGDLGRKARGGPLLGHLEARAGQERPQTRRRRLELDQRAERVEEDSAPQETQCQPPVAGPNIAVAFLVAEIVARAPKRRGKRPSSAVAMGDLSPVATTRLRLVRRLVFALIIVIGLAIVALQFPSVKRVATTLLASS